MRAGFLWSRCWSALGPAGVCGLLAALVGVWLHAVPVQQAQAEVAALQAQGLAASVASSPSAPGKAGDAPQAFEALFPRADTLPDWLERIESASAATGVVVERTEYRVAGDAPAKLARYQIALPVKGTYAQVRAFVAALLQAVPTLAVTDIDVKRDAIGAATVEGRLNVSVYLSAVPR